MPQMLAAMLKQDGVAVRQKDVLVGGRDLRSHSLDAEVKDLLQVDHSCQPARICVMRGVPASGLAQAGVYVPLIAATPCGQASGNERRMCSSPTNSPLMLCNSHTHLQEGKWDYVVLQDHSSVPGGADEKVYADTLVALSTFFAGRLPSSSNENGRPGKALLFNTWGHKDGSCKDRPQHKPAYPTYLAMQDRTSRGYLEYKATLEAAVDDVDVRIVPVGEAFRLIYLAVEKAGQDPQHPDSLFARLYAADGYHPSRLGSFLAACVFYGVISGNSPKFLEFDVRGRTLAIEGFLVGKAFVDSVFDDYMINKVGPEKWQPEPLTPELVRPLQAFAHAVLYPDDASEPIELPSRAVPARPSRERESERASES
jgi:hypothetical protein